MRLVLCQRTMDKLTIVLFAIFSTSVAVMYDDDYDNFYQPQPNRQKAIDDVATLERYANGKYDRSVALFRRYNKTTMEILEDLNKSYNDDINQFLTKGEDELIVPGVPIFAECKGIFDELSGNVATTKRYVNYCTSTWASEKHMQYLHELEKSWKSIKVDLDSAKMHITDGGKKQQDGGLVETDDGDNIIDIINTTASTCKKLKKRIDRELRMPSWADNSVMHTYVNKCPEAQNIRNRKFFSELVINIKNCVSSNKKRFT